VRATLDFSATADYQEPARFICSIPYKMDRLMSKSAEPNASGRVASFDVGDTSVTEKVDSTATAERWWALAVHAYAVAEAMTETEARLIML
jgi:hypothetical protein